MTAKEVDRGDPDVRAAERAIENTRADLAQTLDAIERKLAPRHLVEKGIDMFNDAYGGTGGLNRGLEVIRDNPIPFALIGIGAAWLIASNTGIAAQIERLASDERVEAVRRRAADLVAGVASDIGTRAGRLASDAAATVGLGEGSGSAAELPLGHTGNPMVDDTGRSGSETWVHQAADMAQDALRSAKDSGGEMLNRAGDGATRIADQVSEAFERHPLAIGAIGVIGGALLALLLPATRAEDAALGGTRDELWQKAQEAGQQAVSRVREVGARAAARAVDAAAEYVKDEIGKSEIGRGDMGRGEIGRGAIDKPSHG
jgi:hypothetical protein